MTKTKDQIIDRLFKEGILHTLFKYNTHALGEDWYNK